MRIGLGLRVGRVRGLSARGADPFIPFFTTSPQNFSIQNSGAGYAYSRTDETYRFEVRDGDQWASDVSAGSGVERSEIQHDGFIDFDTTYQLTFDFLLEAGSPNESWLIMGQLHHRNDGDESGGSPPITFEVSGEKQSLLYRYSTENPRVASPSQTSAWDAPDTIVRGQWYSLKLIYRIDPFGNGRLNLFRNGVEVCNYSGPVGYVNDQGGYWKFGVYRSGANVATTACQFRNIMNVAVADALAGTTDPQFADVVFLNGFNGANGATSSTEESSAAVAGVFAGTGAALTTTNPLFGTACFQGATTGAVGFADPGSNRYQLGASGTAPFCVEFAARFSSNVAQGSNKAILSCDNGTGWAWDIAHRNTTNSLNFEFSLAGSTMVQRVIVSDMTTLAVDTWHRFAVDYDGTTLRCFVNGVPTLSSTLTGALFYGTGMKITVGGFGDNTGRTGHAAVDEVRITKASRRTAAYTPDAFKFPRRSS